MSNSNYLFCLKQFFIFILCLCLISPSISFSYSGGDDGNEGTDAESEAGVGGGGGSGSGEGGSDNGSGSGSDGSSSGGSSSGGSSGGSGGSGGSSGGSGSSGGGEANSESNNDGYGNNPGGEFGGTESTYGGGLSGNGQGADGPGSDSGPNGGLGDGDYGVGGGSTGFEGSPEVGPSANNGSAGTPGGGYGNNAASRIGNALSSMVSGIVGAAGSAYDGVVNSAKAVLDTVKSGLGIAPTTNTYTDLSAPAVNPGLTAAEFDARFGATPAVNPGLTQAEFDARFGGVPASNPEDVFSVSQAASFSIAATEFGVDLNNPASRAMVSMMAAQNTPEQVRGLLSEAKNTPSSVAAPNSPAGGAQAASTAVDLNAVAVDIAFGRNGLTPTNQATNAVRGALGLDAAQAQAAITAEMTAIDQRERAAIAVANANTVTGIDALGSIANELVGITPANATPAPPGVNVYGETFAVPDTPVNRAKVAELNDIAAKAYAEIDALANPVGPEAISIENGIRAAQASMFAGSQGYANVSIEGSGNSVSSNPSASSDNQTGSGFSGAGDSQVASTDEIGGGLSGNGQGADGPGSDSGADGGLGDGDSGVGGGLSGNGQGADGPGSDSGIGGGLSDFDVDNAAISDRIGGAFDAVGLANPTNSIDFEGYDISVATPAKAPIEVNLDPSLFSNKSSITTPTKLSSPYVTSVTINPAQTKNVTVSALDNVQVVSAPANTVAAFDVYDTAKISLDPSINTFAPSDLTEEPLSNSLVSSQFTQVPDDLKAVLGIGQEIYAEHFGFPAMSPGELFSAGKLDITQGGKYDSVTELAALELALAGELPGSTLRAVRKGVMTTTDLIEVQGIVTTMVNRAIAKGTSIEKQVTKAGAISSVSVDGRAAKVNKDGLKDVVAGLASGAFATELGLTNIAPDQLAYASHYYSPAGIDAQNGPKNNKSTPNGWDISTNQPSYVSAGGHVFGNVAPRSGIGYEYSVAGVSLSVTSPDVQTGGSYAYANKSDVSVTAPNVSIGRDGSINTVTASAETVDTPSVDDIGPVNDIDVPGSANNPSTVSQPTDTDIESAPQSSSPTSVARSTIATVANAITSTFESVKDFVGNLFGGGDNTSDSDTFADLSRQDGYATDSNGNPVDTRLTINDIVNVYVHTGLAITCPDLQGVAQNGYVYTVTLRDGLDLSLNQRIGCGIGTPSVYSNAIAYDLESKRNFAPIDPAKLFDKLIFKFYSATSTTSSR